PRRILWQPHHLQHLRRPRANLLTRLSCKLQRHPHIALHGHLWKQSGLLDHIPDPSPQRDHILRRNVAPIHQHAATRRPHQRVHRAQQRGLAGTAPAQQRRRRSLLHVQRNPTQNPTATHREAHIRELHPVSGHRSPALVPAAPLFFFLSSFCYFSIPRPASPPRLQRSHRKRRTGLPSPAPP